MTNIILAGKGLREIVTALSHLLQTGVIIANHEMMCLEYSRVDLLPTEQEGGKSSFRLDQYYPEEVLAQVRGHRGVYYPKPAGPLARGSYLMPVVAGGSFYGVLVAVPADGEPSEEQMVALEEAATTVAMEIIKQRAVDEAEQRIRVDFFNDLLIGNIRGEENIVAQAQSLRETIEDKKMALVVEFDRESPYFQELLSERRKGAFPRLLGQVECFLTDYLDSEVTGANLVQHNHNLVALLPFINKPYQEVYRFCRKLAADLQAQLQGRFPGVPFALGLGGYIYSPREIPRAYRQAQDAIDLRRRVFADNLPALFPDMEAYYLIDRYLIGGGEKTELNNLKERVFGELRRYDQANGSELAQTMAVYIRKGFSKSRTAREMHIHRNTLNYRLTKIQAIIGDDFEEKPLFPYLLAAVAERLEQGKV